MKTYFLSEIVWLTNIEEDEKGFSLKALKPIATPLFIDYSEGFLTDIKTGSVYQLENFVNNFLQNCKSVRLASSKRFWEMFATEKEEKEAQYGSFHNETGYYIDPREWFCSKRPLTVDEIYNIKEKLIKKFSKTENQI